MSGPVLWTLVSERSQGTAQPFLSKSPAASGAQQNPLRLTRQEFHAARLASSQVCKWWEASALCWFKA